MLGPMFSLKYNSVGFSSIAVVLLLPILAITTGFGNRNAHLLAYTTLYQNWPNGKTEVCQLQMNAGNCTRNFPRFYFDSTRGRCFKFIYTGCGGNANRFLSRHQCKRRCHPKFRRRKHQKTRVSATLTQNRAAEHHRQLACLSNCFNGVCMRGECQCKRGFEQRGMQCVDSNECHWTSCAENALCVNLPGSFRCECRTGFAGSGFNCTQDPRICAQRFDPRYERQCQPEQDWLTRYYFHAQSGECLPFWYGGCQFGDSLNFFPDQKSCESICGGYSQQQKEHFADFGAVAVGDGAVAPYQHSKESELYTITHVPHNDTFGPCMDPFDESLRSPCMEGLWKRRYYFDPTMGRCRVFWMDTSCPSPREEGSRSRNIFVHMSNCRRACEGEELVGDIERDEEWRWREWDIWKTGNSKNSRKTGVIQASFTSDTTAASSTTMATTTVASSTHSEQKDDCSLVLLNDQLVHAQSIEEKKQRLARLKAKLKLEERRHKLRKKHKQELKQQWQKQRQRGSQSDACFEPFDWALTKSCGRIPWRARFFYDARHAKCRPFWNDGCRAKTRNNFRNEANCRRKCEREGQGHQQKQGPAQLIRQVETSRGQDLDDSNATICSQPFDANYRRACNNGRGWQRKWFFDFQSGLCRHFWYDGCTGNSRNFFEGLKECMDLCVQDNDAVHRPAPSLVTEDKSLQHDFAFFAGGDPASSLGFWTPKAKNYLRTDEIGMDEHECTGFRFNASGGKACLSTFLCLMEEGGGCQRSVHWAVDGDDKCHVERPWLKGRHIYAWFFTLESRPSWMDPKDVLQTYEGRRKTASAVLTLRQSQLNITNSALVPAEQFGTTQRQKDTVVWVDIVSPEECETGTKCQQ